LIKECTRVINIDPNWIASLSKNKQSIKGFYLDRLLQDPDTAIRKVGEEMVAILLVKIPELTIPEIINNSQENDAV